jgi:chromosome segregation ATPase
MASESAWPDMRVRVPASLHAEHQRRAEAAGLKLSQHHRRVLEAALLTTTEAADLADEVSALREQIRSMARQREEFRASLQVLTRDRDRLRRKVSALLPHAALGRMLADVAKAFEPPRLPHEEAESTTDALRERLEENAAEVSVWPPWIRAAMGAG